MAFTNKGKEHLLGHGFNQVTPLTQFRVVLCTADDTPTADTNTFSELTEIAAGNGYSSGGTLLTANTTDFPNLTEDDSNDRGKIEIKNLSWTASGGPIPATGNGARYLVLIDNNATPANREVWGWWDFGGNKSVADGQAFTVGDASNPIEMRLS